MSITKKTGRQTALGFTELALCKKASPLWWECGDRNLARQSSSDLCAGGTPSSPGLALAGGCGFGPPQQPDNPHGLKTLLRVLILSWQPQSCALIQTTLRLVPNTPSSRESPQQYWEHPHKDILGAPLRGSPPRGHRTALVFAMTCLWADWAEDVLSEG